MLRLIGHHIIPSPIAPLSENLLYEPIASFDINQVVVICANDKNCGFCGEYCVEIALARPIAQCPLGSEADAAPSAFGPQLGASVVLPPRQTPTDAPKLLAGSNRIFNPTNIQQSYTKQMVGQPQHRSRKTDQATCSIKP